MECFVNQKLRLLALSEVTSYRTGHYVYGALIWLMDSQPVGHRHCHWSYVKRASWLGRNPPVLESDEGLDQSQQFLFIKFWQGNLLATEQKSIQISLGPKKPQLVLWAFESLHSLEAGNGIVKSRVKGVYSNGSKWSYFGSLPARLLAKANLQ